MASYRAVGAVSDTLRDLLKDRMELPTEFTNLDLNFDVTVLSPRPRTQSSEPREEPRVNLFLYRVTENEFLKNQEIPGRGGASGYGHPPLSLNLHYLVTGYGTTGEGSATLDTPAHYLLGSAMRVLHDHPLVTERLLRQNGARAGEPLLSPHLLGEFEKLKLIMEPLSIEDITKIFTALAHPYRPSAAYMVSVVQIESKRGRTYPRLVGERPGGPSIVVLPTRAPVITEVLVRPEDRPTVERSTPYLRVGDVLILKGSGFAGESVRVLLGRLEIPVQPSREDVIEVQIPDATYPDGASIPVADRLQPGPLAVSVLSRVPQMPHAGVSSNRAALMLVPRVLAPVLDQAAIPPTLTVPGRRLHHPDLSGQALLGRHVFPKTSYAAAAQDQITLALPDTIPGRDVPCLVGGPLVPYTTPAPVAELDVTLAPQGPRTVTLGIQPANVQTAARALQAGLRAEGDAGYRFGAARVVVVDDRLVVIPGGMRGDPSAGPTLTDPATANTLKLRTTGVNPPAEVRRAILSGPLPTFPDLRAQEPRIRLHVGAALHDVALAQRPTTLEDARAALHAGLLVVRPDALVGIVDNQLLVLLATTEPIRFEEAPGDATTVGQLMLHARHAVRVRVNGADSIDDAGVTLP